MRILELIPLITPMKIIIFSLSLLVTFYVVPSSAASNPSDCVVISKDKKRLKCYDRFFKDNPQSIYLVKDKAEEQTKSDISPQNNFGKELIAKTPAQKTPNSISSLAKGSFKHWKKGLEVDLENGQKWKISDNKKALHRIKSPKITIERGFLDVYYMKVEGLNKKFKVKRIK